MDEDLRLHEAWVHRRDGEAFAELMRRHLGMAYAVGLRITRNAHDAEEVAQDAFVALARAKRGADTSVAGWLHTVARNAAL